MGDDMADETLIKKRITTYTKTVSKSNLTNSDVMFVDNPTEGTRKLYPKAVINNTITSSGVHVHADSPAITDVNDQPVNTVYTYDYNLQSIVANLPSNKGQVILHYSHNYSENTSAGQVMIAIERGNDEELSMYFRTTSGNPVVWNAWQKLANTSELSNVFTGERLSGDTDLNTITTQGIYFIHSSKTYANCPVDKQNGLLEVWLNNSNNNPDRIFQRLTTQSEDYDQKVYFRIYSSYYNKWTPWEECGSEKKYIRILFIGNSLIQDGVSYLPYILKTYYPEVSFEIYMWYNSGHTLQQNYEKFLSGTPCKIFSTAINTATWTQNKDNMKMSEILTTMKFDIVCMQPFLSVAEVDTELDAWNNCIDYIKSNYTGGNSLKFVSILHAPKRSNVESDVTKFKAWKKALMTETICEDVIPMGLAIYNALSTELDSLGDQGHLSTDGVHAQEGLPCLLQAYILAQWILDELSIPKGIYNKKISMTTEIYNSINVPGPNLGTGVITGTGGQNILAQEIAIKTYLNEKNAINIINNAITSSGVSVTADNYRSIITNVNDQPVNTIYAYAAGLQSSITNLPSNAALNILHYTYKYSTATNVGQVMIATEHLGNNSAMYFRTTSGSPVTWNSWLKLANSADVTDVENEINNLKADLNYIFETVDNISCIDIDHEISVNWSLGWYTPGGGYVDSNYSYITDDYIQTEYVDKVLIYNTSTYAGYIRYFDKNHSHIVYTYIGNDNQYEINKEYPYFKLIFYRKDQANISASELENVRMEFGSKIIDTVSVVNADIDNLLLNNGSWFINLNLVKGGYSLSSSRIGTKIFASAPVNRLRTTNAIIIRQDNAIVKSGYNNAYVFMWARVDENDILLEFGAYTRTAKLSKGRYYFMFKKQDNTTITDSDVSAIKNAFVGYYVISDDLLTMDLNNMFCGNWYGELNGKVTLGDSVWSADRPSSDYTAIILLPFYTDHAIYIKNNVSDIYKWRDSVSDANENITYSTGYIYNDKLIKVPAGHHHIMVTRGTATEVDYDAMAQSVTIFATRDEVYEIEKNTGGDVIERNIDIQNPLYAIKKPDRFGNPSARTLYFAQATDSHGDYVRWMNFMKTINHYDPEIVVHTGDMVKYTTLNDTTHFFNNLPEMPMLLTIGNHEVGAGQNIGSGGVTNQELFDNLIAPLNTKYNIGATKTYYSYTTKTLQYSGGIKFIVLNVYDYDANDGTIFVDRAHIYYSQEQVTWLIAELQDAVANNNPVVICAHECDAYLEPSAGGETPFNQTYERQRLYSKTWEGNPICDLLEAFITGGSINETYVETGSGITLTVNATFARKGHFVTWLVGHRHADYMGFLPGYSQLVISPCATACSIDSPNSTANHSDLPRMEGQRCEDAFNMYVITPDNHTIGIVRVGSNINYEQRERKSYFMKYIKS